MAEELRERKKTDRARRRSLIRNPQSGDQSHSWVQNGAAALAAAAVIAGGTVAYAAPVRFDNPAGPDYFQWFGAPVSQVGLDLVLGANAQSVAISGPSTAIQSIFSTSSDLAQAAGGIFNFEKGGLGNYFLVGVDSGTLIPSGLPTVNW